MLEEFKNYQGFSFITEDAHKQCMNDNAYFKKINEKLIEAENYTAKINEKDIKLCIHKLIHHV